MKAEMKGQSAIEHTLLLNSMKFTTWTIILVNPFSNLLHIGDGFYFKEKGKIVKSRTSSISFVSIESNKKQKH